MSHRVADGGAPHGFATWYGSEVTSRLRRIALAATAGLVVAGLFYAVNSFAAAYGAGRGYDDAVGLPERPEVILDTKERLVDVPPGVTERDLPADKDAAFRYRYSGLRLLLESGERLFLVPGNWTVQSKTLVVPYDSDIRIQLIPLQSDTTHHAVVPGHRGADPAGGAWPPAGSATVAYLAAWTNWSV